MTIPLNQTSFLLDLLLRSEPASRRFNLEAEDTFDKLMSMSPVQRSALLRYIDKRPIKVAQILQSLGIKFNN